MQAALRRAAPYALAYALWLIGCAVCMVALLQFQSAANAVGAALGANRYGLRLANQVILLLGGLVAFGYAVFLEGYYRQGVDRGLALRSILLRRFGKTMAVPLAVIVLSLAASEIALRLLS